MFTFFSLRVSSLSSYFFLFLYGKHIAWYMALNKCFLEKTMSEQFPGGVSVELQTLGQYLTDNSMGCLIPTSNVTHIKDNS